MSRDVTTAASVILAKYEDDNEFHFHEIDRSWIIKAMIEYAELRIKDKQYANPISINTDRKKETQM
jgi:hypothetical protein